MLFLTIGVPVTDHNNRLYLDDIAYFDLLNRIGRKLRQIGSLNVSQIITALDLAETGGYIRWHTLSTEREIISLTDWCVNTYQICFGLVEPAPGMSVNVLDLPDLCKVTCSRPWTRFDRLIEVEEDRGIIPSTSSPSVTNTVDAGPPVTASLQSVDLPPGPDAGPASYRTPSSPQVNQAVNTPQSVSTPYSTSVATPVGFVNTPGSDAGASSYPTPSTNYANSPRVDEPTTRLSSSVLPLNQTVEALDSRGNRQTQQQTREQTIVRSLQSCIFTDENMHLDNNQIQEIIKARASLFPRDPFRILRPLLDNAGSTLSSLVKLGLPDEWEGINGAVNYFRVLDKDKAKKIRLGTLARRVAQILLHLNYESLRNRGERVLDTILDAYDDDPNKVKGKISSRDRFTTYYARLGKWWWKLAIYLGFGILLVADDIAKNMYMARAAYCGPAYRLNNKFSNDQIDAFITFALRTRPDTIQLYYSLEPVAKSLLSGKVPAGLRQILIDANTGLLRHNALEDAHTQDENASRSQETVYSWKVENSIPYAEKNSDFS
ncbi:hypothetical protein BBP40_005980 [Aspergillus hancockii]|nr:hypothetical protein BBP40_005980 [Aspergillus hancockii]